MESSLKPLHIFKESILKTLEKIASENSITPAIQNTEGSSRHSPFPLPISPKEGARNFRLSENTQKRQFSVTINDNQPRRLSSPKDPEENEPKEKSLNRYYTNITDSRSNERVNLALPANLIPKSVSPGRSEDGDSTKNPFEGRFFNFSSATSPNSQIKKYSSDKNGENLGEFDEKSHRLKDLEIAFKKTRDENDSLKRKLETLTTTMNEGKESNEKKVFFLTQEIKSLKSENLALLQKLSKKKENEKMPLIKKSATNIDEKELEMMDKERLVECINKLQEENCRINLKVLEQADDLFEKFNEIMHLQTQKNELFSQVNSLSEENKEIADLKEHINYLLNTVRMLKENLPKLAETYKMNRPKRLNSIDKSNDEVLHTIDRMSHLVNDNLQIVAEKRQDRLKLINLFGGSQLVYSLQNKVKTLLEQNKNKNQAVSD